MKVVTAGSAFLDIDAYAGCIAYAELLGVQGFDAVAYSSAPLNESVTKTIRSWPVTFETSHVVKNDDEYVLIDISESKFFDPIVSDLSKVTGVIDHHTGFEIFWEEKLGKAANIEFIGAACTLVYEAWERADALEHMSQITARLLTAGILDNTLNFTAHVTTGRDKKAYDRLMLIAGLTGEWPAIYFSECQSAIAVDLTLAVQNDTKMLRPELHLPTAFGQLVVWDAVKLVTQRGDEIADALNSLDPHWAINVASISEKSSYFMAGNESAEKRLAALLGVTFLDGIAKADRLWLRKEIIKAAEVS